MKYEYKDFIGVESHLKDSPLYNNLIVTCDKICLIHNSLEIEIHISNEKIERFETITINGITFKKEVK